MFARCSLPSRSTCQDTHRLSWSSQGCFYIRTHHLYCTPTGVTIASAAHPSTLTASSPPNASSPPKFVTATHLLVLQHPTIPSRLAPTHPPHRNADVGACCSSGFACCLGVGACCLLLLPAYLFRCCNWRCAFSWLAWHSRGTSIYWQQHIGVNYGCLSRHCTHPPVMVHSCGG